jgi:hypothetical protein
MRIVKIFFLFACIILSGYAGHYGYTAYQAYHHIPDKTLVICSPYAGLGNQMFQYAASLSLAKKLNSPIALFINRNILDLKDTSTSKRSVGLGYFSIPNVKKIIQKSSLKFFKDKIILVDDANFFDITEKNKLYRISDWFESEYFFENVKDEVRTNLNPEALPRGVEAKKWEGLILTAGKKSCFVHIRRGDFLGNTLPPSYTQKAIKMMRENHPHVVFFLFSDDAEYLKENFTPSDSLHIVSDGTLNSLEEFYLMTRCTHGIIANSTFSWWAAYLRKNPEGTIMAPNPRFPAEYFGADKDPKVAKWKKDFYVHHPEHVYPKEWIRVSFTR